MAGQVDRRATGGFARRLLLAAGIVAAPKCVLCLAAWLGLLGAAPELCGPPGSDALSAGLSVLPWAAGFLLLAAHRSLLRSFRLRH